MARSQRTSVVDELFELLSAAPAWLGPIIALVTFATCRWAIPFALSATSSGNLTGRTLSQVWSGLAVQFAPFVGGVVLLIWAAAEIRKWTNRRRLNQQTGIESISRLSWKEFEALLCEAFRRQGFIVEHSGKPTADGGVDIRLSKAGAVTLVQCKHWKQRRISVTTVRELMGVVSSERAQTGIVVTSGSFTNDATAFASRNPIRVIDGTELVQLIASAQPGATVPQKNTSNQMSPPAPTIANQVSCPVCGAEMRLRTAKTGKHAGSQFYGCTRYPTCRGLRNLSAAET